MNCAKCGARRHLMRPVNGLRTPILSLWCPACISASGARNRMWGGWLG